jgi:hypothetical protein
MEPDPGTIASVKRRLQSVLAGLSLILALASGGLWGRSYRVGDLLLPKGNNSIQSFRGVVMLQWAESGLLEKYTWVPMSSSDKRAAALMLPRYAPNGFSCSTWGPPSYRYLVIALPYWFVVLAFAILPTLCGWQLLRARKRRSENLCPQCGYDVRATPQRCPECGHEGRKRERQDAMTPS